MLALTLGDPAGIGPEIITVAWPEILQICPERPIVLGHAEILRRAAQLQNLNLEIEKIALSAISKLNDTSTTNGKFCAASSIPCINVVDDAAITVKPGQVNPIAGKAAYDALVCGIDLALSRKVDAIVTAPLQKESLNLAGFHYPGHTEILAEKCGCTLKSKEVLSLQNMDLKSTTFVGNVGTQHLPSHLSPSGCRDYAMMLYLGPGENLQGQHGLAVVHVTLHTSMKNALEEITQDNILAKALLIDDFMRKMKGGKPNIGVCSLNPHAGENGLFGDEEIRIIRPAIEQARSQGLSIEGPFPADTIMVQAKNGRFDAVVAMFHDQGHIALKLLGMHRAVNITLGLPIIRTSVAHGTAFDKAGTGQADHRSLLEAVRVAQKLAGFAGYNG